MYKRWYDVDPTISLAVSLMRNANIITQYKCADLIVKTAQENGFNLSENPIGMIQTRKLQKRLNTLNCFRFPFRKPYR